MGKTRVYTLLWAFCGLSGMAQVPGQNNYIEGGSELNVIYRKEHSGAFYLHSRGMGFLYRKSNYVNVKQKNYFEIDVCNLKHPKEIKVEGTAFDRKRFVYGKLDNVLLLKAALGSQHVFYNKADLEAVEVRYSYSIGPGVAFLKPYYVQVNTLHSSSGTREAPFNEATFTKDSVMGRASLFTGFDEMKFRPVLTAKFNLSFEYAHYTNIIRAIETSVCVDYFPKSVQIMARNPAENVVVTLRLGFVFGRKFY
ncbi:MAG TPA: hypothetical protein PLQ93_01555 [Bacteroidia bacterium]|nr:hypothetical protein [Bacteroidia bacterium]